MHFVLSLFLAFSTVNLTGQLNSNLQLKQTGRTYANFCGIAGTQPPTRIMVEELIETRNIKELESWATSPNLVVQTYAAEAFIRLYNGGIPVSDDLIERVLVIKESESLISTCHGCIVSDVSIRKALEEFKFNDITP